MLKYIIAAPTYNPNSGGCIVLHKLCDMLNTSGHKAMICPMEMVASSFNEETVLGTIKRRLSHPIAFARRVKRTFFAGWRFNLSAEFNTPLVNPFLFLKQTNWEDYVVVYPDIVVGNPLKAKNVLRYFMHNPGHFTGKTEFGNGELYIRYSNSFARDFKAPQGGYVVPEVATINTCPACYNMQGVNESKRKGTAYIIRKGKGKNIVHSLDDSILVDGKSHEETAEIFKKVKCFITYDPITAYSNFAIRCGCPTFIVLNDNETPDTYYKGLNIQKCYKFVHDNAPLDENSNKVDMHEAQEIYRKIDEDRETRNKNSVQLFINETKKFFGLE